MARCTDVARTSYAVLTSCYVAPMLITSCTFSRYRRRHTPSDIFHRRARGHLSSPVRTAGAVLSSPGDGLSLSPDVVRRSRDVACLDSARRDAASRRRRRDLSATWSVESSVLMLGSAHSPSIAPPHSGIFPLLPLLNLD